MRGIAIVVLSAALPACSFNGQSKVAGDAAAGSAIDAAGSGTIDMGATIDTPPAVARPLFVAADTTLYKIDLAMQTATSIGKVSQSSVPIAALDGLAFDGTNLVGLDGNGTNLLSIDPATANILGSRSLQVVGLSGLTIIPPNEIGNTSPIVLAASGTALYSIAPATGNVVKVGDLEATWKFHTDLAWVHGHGLYITLEQDPSHIDLFQIDPATAATIADLHSGYDNVNGLSGYHDQLWGVSTGGFVYQCDLTTGVLSAKVTGGPQYTEAAQ